MQGKIIFITGGVLSSLGKGIIASSLGRLFKDQGLNINMMKCDPYLNVDSGTMSPIEHGEVFVTADGGETDLDIGHYERFLGQNLSKSSSLTTGTIYSNVLNKERSGGYLGKTVQVFPHIMDEIKLQIKNNLKGYDLLFVEVGGTIGDIESIPYLEAISQIIAEDLENNFLIHAAYVPLLRATGELKTKPTQHSVKQLMSLGIKPNMIVTRNEIALSESEINKIAMFCSVKKENVIQSIDVDNIYQIPLLLKKQKVDQKIADFLSLDLKHSDHLELSNVIDKINHATLEIKVAIVGKYTQLADAYISVTEAIKHSAIVNQVKTKIDLIPSQNISIENLKDYDAIIVPGGFGESGIDGKLETIKYARENNISFLGICLGMQLSIIDFATNVCNLKVEHQELNPKSKNPIIHLMEDQDLEKLGGTQRLGNYNCQLIENTKVAKIYQSNLIQERHRHRYEFNNKYKEVLENNGLVFSGINPELDLVEIIEYPKNDFFVAVQYHPELSSKLTQANPLFIELIKSAKKRKLNKKENNA